MALVNAFFPRESPTRLLHLWQMFEDLFMNLLRIWSRCFSNCCFCVGSKGESVHKPFKSGLSILHSLPGLLGISPVGFQRQMFWGSSLWWRSQGSGFLMWSTNPLLLQEKHWVGFLVRLSLCLSYLSWCGYFISFSREAVHLVFRSFSEGNGPSICSCRFAVSMGSSEFRILLRHYLVELWTYLPSSGPSWVQPLDDAIK